MRLRFTLRPVVLLSAMSLLPAPSGAGDLSWMEIRLSRNPGGRCPDRNEGCALGDIDRDGKLDVVAGGWWYRAPNWDRRKIRDLGGDLEFAYNNGDHVLDVDGDGWVDVISGSWMQPEVFWYQNPGKSGLEADATWKPHLIGRLGACEGKFLHDFAGDGIPELVLDSWEDDVPVHVYELTRGAGGPTFTLHKIGKRSGHGMGIGDLNGDGRADIVVKDGWYETPAKPFETDDWPWHPELDLGHTSLPFAIHDVDADGLADIVYGQGHGYGLSWLEQGKGDGGKRTWTRHAIEEGGSGPGSPLPRDGMVLSQVHCIVFADLDADGKPELITGKRLRGHGDGDDGWKEPIGIYYHTWDAAAKRFSRHVISESPGIAGAFGAKSANEELQLRGAVGTGMQINVADLNGDGRADIAVAGKSGTYILANQPDAR